MEYIIGIAISFFLAILLWTKRCNTLADKILSIFLFFSAIHASYFYLLSVKNNYDFPFLLGLQIPIPLFYGPLLYLYIGTLTNQINIRDRKILYHFVFPIVSFLLIIPFLFTSGAHKVYVFQHNGVGYESITVTNQILLMLSSVIYTIGSLWLLQKHRKRIKDEFSDIERINLFWIKYLIYGLICIWILVFFVNDTWVFRAATVYVIFLGYLGINQVGIFQQHSVANVLLGEQNVTPLEIENIDRKKYAKSGLNEEAANGLHSALQMLMKEQKCYIEPELTLSDLAKKLDVHTNYLSQVINEKEAMTFYDYINKYRVEAFIEQLQKPENRKFTLLGLAYQCGFNSKSAFNRQFKKVTGLSPTEYQNQKKT